MRHRFVFMDHDGRSTYKSPTEYQLRHSCGDHLLCQITSLVDSSLYHSKCLSSTGTSVIREALDCIFKFTGALIFPFASGAKSKLHRNLSGDQHGSKHRNHQFCLQGKQIYPRNLMEFKFGSESRSKSDPFAILSNFLASTIRCILNDVQQLPLFPVLSLASALIPPFDNLSKKAIASPLSNTDVQMKGGMAQAPCLCELRRLADISFSEINWRHHAFEPKTGIKFPAVLDNFLAEQNKFSLTSELLVGTGCRSMKILRIKSLDVYAFGLYVHPDSVCEKLGPKYASVSPSELNNQPEFFEDLLREDINMTVRLVVNCNGLKVNTVRDIFERSLRTRLLKMNPDTDYHCVTAFGSYFTQDISFPVGTIVDFRQTAEGKLITEIGGKQIGAVHSKDLCRAFFDMYIGDVSVPSYAKEEIAKNVASIIKRC
ncbi:fatty-acid-binding protein 2-like isoform X2 [Papaver somniferum]|uniref:fatty-acid-binding protein 2-like isoform X2 n=1 Tax=Papaver somniferum TaxID=3469 RepID=UPI000E6F7317|nr:fatty-acid-binding protein 2-like isoform X2 [Papaver somniferum]